MASSAPVQASLEMRGYNNVVAASLVETDVGGSEACVASVRAAFAELSDALSTPTGRRGLDVKFNVCGGAAAAAAAADGVPVHYGGGAAASAGGVAAGGGGGPLELVANRMELVAALSEVFPVQSNDPSCARPACDIRAACAAMTKTSAASPVPHLTRLAALAAAAFGAQCVDVDHAAGRLALNATSLDPKGSAGYGERSWFWQTCTEFGFYQTCVPGSDCPFLTTPPLLTLGSFTDECAAVFGGLDYLGVTAPAAGRANERTGGWRPGGTRILYPSGTVDPW